MFKAWQSNFVGVNIFKFPISRFYEDDVVQSVAGDGYGLAGFARSAPEFAVREHEVVAPPGGFNTCVLKAGGREGLG